MSTHALSGEVKFEHWGDDESVALSVRRAFLDAQGKQALEITRARRSTKHLLYTFAGVTNPDEAARLRGKTLWASRADVAKSEDTVFWADLIGEEVRTPDGTALGRIRDIYNRGASDIWEIETADKTVLFPAAPVFVKSVSTTGAVIDPPEGLF